MTLDNWFCVNILMFVMWVFYSCLMKEIFLSLSFECQIKRKQNISLIRVCTYSRGESRVKVSLFCHRTLIHINVGIISSDSINYNDKIYFYLALWWLHTPHTHLSMDGMEKYNNNFFFFCRRSVREANNNYFYCFNFHKNINVCF